MSKFNKTKVVSAMGGNHYHPFDFVHVTTQDFFDFRVLRAFEVIPNGNYNISVGCTSQCVPLVRPAYANVAANIHAFFVPFRTVMRNWNAFKVETSERAAYISHVPYISIGTVVRCVMEHALPNDELREGFDNDGHVSAEGGYHGYIGDASKKYDFAITHDVLYGDEYFNNDQGVSALDIQQVTTFYRLDVNGRRFVNILLGLGKKIPLFQYMDKFWKERPREDTEYTDPNGNYFQQYTDIEIDSSSLDFNYRFSALPLLCLGKVYADWFTNSQFEVTINTIEAAIETIATQQQADFENAHILLNLMCNTCYDADYFTNSFTSPLGGQTNDISEVQDISTSNIDENGNVVGAGKKVYEGTGLNGTPYFNSGSFQSSHITQYLLKQLNRMTDIARRNLLAGVRPLDRWLARFGIKLDDCQLERSSWLGSYKQQFEISTVTNQNGSGNEPLGEYAAQMRSITNKNGRFTFQNAKEYGMVILTSNITPKVGYFQGDDRLNYHLTANDFWTPEYDGNGVQAIAQYELNSASLYDNDLPLTEPDKAFNYTSRYAEYKNINDVVSGDFAFDSRNEGLDSWHLLRQIDGNPVYTEAFAYGNFDAAQYKRIFSAPKAGFDPFKVFYNFHIDANLPARPLFDDYEFDSRGRETTLRVNGTKLDQ